MANPMFRAQAHHFTSTWARRIGNGQIIWATSPRYARFWVEQLSLAAILGKCPRHLAFLLSKAMKSRIFCGRQANFIVLFKTLNPWRQGLLPVTPTYVYHHSILSPPVNMSQFLPKKLSPSLKSPFEAIKNFHDISKLSAFYPWSSSSATIVPLTDGRLHRHIHSRSRNGLMMTASRRGLHALKSCTAALR